MIEANRPLCIMDYEHYSTLRSFDRHSDPFKDYGLWTLDEEPYSEIQFEWEACQAGISKTVDGTMYFLKCMEPAIYYVRLDHGGMFPGKHVFCKFHRPSVRDNT